jgi:hypothetical protein
MLPGLDAVSQVLIVTARGRCPWCRSDPGRLPWLPAPARRALLYGMNAAFMLLELHDGGIHVVRPGAGGAGVTEPGQARGGAGPAAGPRRRGTRPAGRGRAGISPG